MRPDTKFELGWLDQTLLTANKLKIGLKQFDDGPEWSGGSISIFKQMKIN